MSIDTIFSIVILLMSAVIHEVSHGMAALYLGDPTAKYEGRLTLNPVRHIDLFGSIILPVLLVLAHSGFVFAYAKPVPYNPDNLRNKRWGDAIVAGAGPLSNIILALFFGALLRFGPALGLPLNEAFIGICAGIVFINILLAVFNLVPIPPLDGSKIFFSLLPLRMRGVRFELERYGFFLVLLFIIFIWQWLSPVISYLFELVTGYPL